MSNEFIRFMKKSLLVAVTLFALRVFAVPEIFGSLIIESGYDIISSVGEAIGTAGIIMLLYERFIWRINPLEKTPVISGSYDGEIEYQYNGGGRKRVRAKIKQSLLSVSVLMYTDEISSRSISSVIFNNGSECVLIYSYLTHPKSSVSKRNPIAYGTCRMSIEEKGVLKGTYWTSLSTIGDITLIRESE